MITIKNASQIAKMREAGALLHEVLEQLKGKIEPGITTKELDRYAEKLIRGYGAVPSFLNYEGYPASICASVDSQVVHGIPDESTVLREGQIISIDSGLILDGWQSDSAFTVGVGTVSPQAQRLIDVTEQSFFAALQVAREGYRVSDIGHAVQQYVEERGFSAVRDLWAWNRARDARGSKRAELWRAGTWCAAAPGHDHLHRADDHRRQLQCENASRWLDGSDHRRKPLLALRTHHPHYGWRTRIAFAARIS